MSKPLIVVLKTSPISTFAGVTVLTWATAVTQPARVIVSAVTVFPGVPLTTAVRSAAQSISAVNPVALRIVKEPLLDISKSHAIV